MVEMSFTKFLAFLTLFLGALKAESLIFTGQWYPCNNNAPKVIESELNAQEFHERLGLALNAQARFRVQATHSLDEIHRSRSTRNAQQDVAQMKVDYELDLNERQLWQLEGYSRLRFSGVSSWVSLMVLAHQFEMSDERPWLLDFASSNEVLQHLEIVHDALGVPPRDNSSRFSLRDGDLVREFARDDQGSWAEVRVFDSRYVDPVFLRLFVIPVVNRMRVKMESQVDEGSEVQLVIERYKLESEINKRWGGVLYVPDRVIPIADVWGR